MTLDAGLTLLALAVPRIEPQAAPAALALETSIELPGVEGRIDHLALDLARDRLWVAARENGTVEVVDLDTKKRIKSISGLSEPQGVLVLTAPSRVLVTEGGSGRLAVFEAGTFERAASVDVGPNPDNLRYEPSTKLVYVGFGDGALAIVDPRNWKVVGEVALGSHPESFQFDARSTRAFVNLAAKGEIAVVDLVLGKVVERWPLDAAAKNYPMAIQGADRRLFVACRQPPALLVLDPTSGRPFEALELSGDADDVFLDEASSRLFVACGAGSIDVFKRGEKGAYEPEGKIATAAGARTCVYSPADEKLYLAVPHRGDQRAEIRVYDARR